MTNTFLYPRTDELIQRAKEDPTNAVSMLCVGMAKIELELVSATAQRNAAIRTSVQMKEQRDELKKLKNEQWEVMQNVVSQRDNALKALEDQSIRLKQVQEMVKQLDEWRKCAEELAAICESFEHDLFDGERLALANFRKLKGEK